jgi:hypothetical protein
VINLVLSLPITTVPDVWINVSVHEHLGFSNQSLMWQSLLF